MYASNEIRYPGFIKCKQEAMKIDSKIQRIFRLQRFIDTTSNTSMRLAATKVLEELISG